MNDTKREVERGSSRACDTCEGEREREIVWVSVCVCVCVCVDLKIR